MRARRGRSRSSSSRTTCYFRFLERVRRRGITIPIVPGMAPVQNFKQTANFAKKAGACVPDWLAERFAGLDDDAATRRLIAAAVAAEQVLDLVDHGVEDFHFYTMNRADLVYAVCHLLGVRAAPAEAALEPSKRASLGDEAIQCVARAQMDCFVSLSSRPDEGRIRQPRTRRRREFDARHSMTGHTMTDEDRFDGKTVLQRSTKRRASASSCSTAPWAR